MPPALAAEAWRLGIPVHEGYGLSECCSVVTLNRPGHRAVGTSGRPLSGLQVTIEDGEIVVDGPSITDGYLRQEPAGRPWRTGDLGELDADGFLTVHGRKDDLIVSSFGRNISPEWIEAMILDDPRIALCAVAGRGEPHLTAVLVPSSHGKDWFASASEAELRRLVAERLRGRPRLRGAAHSCRVLARRSAPRAVADGKRPLHPQAAASLPGGTILPRAVSASFLMHHSKLKG